MVDSSAEKRDPASKKIKDKTSLVADQVRDASKRVMDTTSSKVAGGYRTGSRKVAEIASSVADSAQDASRKASDVSIAAARQAKTPSRKALDATTSVANELLATTQGLLASRLSSDVNDLLQNMVKGPATIYDKAMDAGYVATHIGGPNHRLFDGGHTITGAFNAARGASPDDNIIQEAMGTLQGLLRDVSTTKGLPLANWDKETFDQVAGVLESNFHIPASWFYDLNTFDAAELLGSAVGAVALAFNWNRANTEAFAKLVGSMGVAAAVNNNPLLLILTVVALARAFQKAHQTGEYAEFVDGQLKGGVGAGATLTAVWLVGVAGGPAGVALLAGLTAGILVNKATNNVSVVQISQFITAQATTAATEAKRMVEQQMPATPGATS